MKTCSKCKRNKPLDEFYRLSSSKDGKQSWCIGCQPVYYGKNRYERIHYQRRYRNGNDDD